MAERRMFSKIIIDSDVFLDMPLSTQALYFHLSMRADDEGFINNPKKIMRMIGASQNELEILMAKRYLLGFESGVIVVKHWRVHNYIQKDRFKPTIYNEERATIGIKENRSYTESKNVLDTKCIQNVDTGKVREDKNRIDKNRKDKYNPVTDLSFFLDDDFKEAWNDLMKVRDKKKASKSDRAIKTLILKLKKFSRDNKKAAIAILDKSSMSGWSDIYELKDEDKKDLKIPTVPKKATNTDRYNREKLKEQNPEEYTEFNPGSLMAKIKKVNNGQ